MRNGITATANSTSPWPARRRRRVRSSAVTSLDRRVILVTSARPVVDRDHGAGGEALGVIRVLGLDLVLRPVRQVGVAQDPEPGIDQVRRRGTRNLADDVRR